MAGSIMEGLGSSVTGNINKAMLIVFSGNERKAKKISTAKIAEKAAAALGKTSAQVAQSFSASMGGQLSNFHVLEVQYNPSSIEIQANAEDLPMLYLQQNLEQGVPNQLMRPPAVTLHTELLFDAVNLADSFMWEKFTSGVSAQTAANIATANLKSKGAVWSVQDQTNGLLGALLSENTRTVIFKWADMTFAGDITEASARYTMFSTSGRPVRSHVTLRITQKVESTDDITYWDKALDGLFKNDLVSKERSALQKAGNLMHLNF